MAFSTEYIYRIMDKYSTPLDHIIQKTRKFQKAARKASKRISKMGAKMESAAQKMGGLQSAIGGAAIIASMYGFAKSASTIEDAMADVERVTGLSGKALANMQEKLQKMGRETGRSATGLAAIAYEGGKLGIANDKMLAFVLTVTKTAAAFDMVDSEAGRAIGSIRAKLGLSVDSVNNLMQRLNFLADNTSATGNQMIEIVERTSGTFKTLNIPPEVTAGWAAFANQIEVTPQLAASGLNMMMIRMMKMPGMLTKMLKDPKNTVIDFLKRFESMPEAKRGAAILKTFGDEAGRFVMKAVANTKLLNDAMQKAADSKALGSMDREFENILKRSSTAAKRIKETFIDIARTIGSTFLRVFDKYSSRIQETTMHVLNFVKTNPMLVKIGGAFAALLAGIAAIVVPLGLLLTIISAGMPAMAALAGAVGAISAPIVILVGAVVGMIGFFTAAYAKSDKLRASISNLAMAFKPVIDGLKLFAFWAGNKLAGAFGLSGGAIEKWGDLLSIIINGAALAITTIFEKVGNLAEVSAALSMGNFGDAWSAIKKTVGLGTANQKAETRASQNNKVEISGQIGVSASGGAKVEQSNINLNNGYNLAT